jgi:hypothetical protein
MTDLPTEVHPMSSPPDVTGPAGCAGIVILDGPHRMLGTAASPISPFAVQDIFPPTVPAAPCTDTATEWMLPYLGS